MRGLHDGIVDKNSVLYYLLSITYYLLPPSCENLAK